MSGPVSPPLTVTTVGGTPSGRPITTIKVSNGDLTISGNTATIDTSGGGGGGGTVTSIVFSSPLTGGTITTSGTVGIPEADGTTNGYLSSTAYNTFDGKQDAITLTTTGTSGNATLVGSTLNIPNYTNTATIGGSITNQQVAFGDTTANTIQGSANLTFDGTNLSVAGYVKSGTGIFDTDGSTDLILRTNGGTDSGTITIFDGAAQDIEITPNGAGSINLDGLKWPNTDGSANQVLQTDGAGGLSFVTPSAGGNDFNLELPGSEMPSGSPTYTIFLLDRQPGWGTVESSTTSINFGTTNVQYWPFISPKSGDIDKVFIHVNSDGTGQLGVAFYSDNNGVPNAKIGGNTSFTFGSLGTGVTSAAPASTVTLSRGVQYWMAFIELSSGNGSIMGTSVLSSFNVGPLSSTTTSFSSVYNNCLFESGTGGVFGTTVDLANLTPGGVGIPRLGLTFS